MQEGKVLPFHRDYNSTDNEAISNRIDLIINEYVTDYESFGPISSEEQAILGEFKTKLINSLLNSDIDTTAGNIIKHQSVIKDGVYKLIGGDKKKRNLDLDVDKTVEECLTLLKSRLNKSLSDELKDGSETSPFEDSIQKEAWDPKYEK